MTQKTLANSCVRVCDQLVDPASEGSAIDARRRLDTNVTFAEKDPPPDDKHRRVATQNLRNHAWLKPEGNPHTELPLREDTSNTGRNER
jgi:hypothetical protein